MNRREFLTRSLYTSLVFGSGVAPSFISQANAAPAPLLNNLLINVTLDGGPDFRHMIVPEYSSDTSSFAYKYWSNRTRTHHTGDNPSAWQARWNDHYYPITIDAPGTPNHNVTFGIWKEAGWLIDMFENGNVAVICNAVGGLNRAHDHSTLILNQGDTSAGSQDYLHSGWGGRLARVANSNIVSVSRAPSGFCFGPTGASPSFDRYTIDNRDLFSLPDTRAYGLYGYDSTLDQNRIASQKLARSLSSYYAALRGEQVSDLYDKALDHQQKIEQFGELIDARLDFAENDLIRALYSSSGHSVNNDSSGVSRRVLNSGLFGVEMRNLSDCIAVNDLLNMRVASMSYGNWDTHAGQTVIASSSDDLNDPDLERGIENNIKDLFGGPYGNASVGRPNDLHSGFSALWQALDQNDKDRVVITLAGEFGRQIRDNGDFGTDHGSGNIMLVVGNAVNGGVYGEMFPEAEIDLYDNGGFTPDILGLTQIDQIFAPVCDWVVPGSGDIVFPNRANADIEPGVSFDNLFS